MCAFQCLFEVCSVQRWQRYCARWLRCGSLWGVCNLVREITYIALIQDRQDKCWVKEELLISGKWGRMWCRQHHLTMPWREKELFSKEREAKGNLEGEMCVRISTDAWCASCGVCFERREFCGRNTECEQDAEGSEAGKLGADHVLWYCKKPDLHSGQQGSWMWSLGALVAEVALHLAISCAQCL